MSSQWTVWSNRAVAVAGLAASALSLGLRLAAGAAGTTQTLPQAQIRTVLEWSFEQAGQLEGWQPNAHLRDVAVSNGLLRARAVGADPILELTKKIDFPASAWNQIEVRLKADRGGMAEFFWSNTTTGRYGGFTAQKSTQFNVLGDGQWHTYQLMPFWHTEGRIVRLRFDVFDGAQFELDFIRINELLMPPAVTNLEFDFTQGAQGWQTVARQPGSTLVLSPPVRFEAASNGIVSVCLAAVQSARGAAGVVPMSPGQVPESIGLDALRRPALLVASSSRAGLQRVSLPVGNAGLDGVWNLDMWAEPGWRGTVIALGLEVPEPAGMAVTWLKISDTPQGPPQLRIDAFRPEATLPRVGRPVWVQALLSNTGGQTATNVQVHLTLPDAVRLRPDTTATQTVATLGFDEQVALRWAVEARTPGRHTVRLMAQAANAKLVVTEVGVDFTPAPAVPPASYVPAPKPVRGPYEVGVYYFPGWQTASQWQPIYAFPERRPALGWYREGDPEVADWQIKWAVEHGITFFVYDWYWDRGQRQLEHALHQGYFNARYRSLLKFCLLWANHNPPGSSSLEDCRAVTRYWIQHYFRRPEHLTVGGQPVVLIFSPDRLRADLGSAGARAALEAMRAECRQAGLKGLRLIACVGDLGGARQAAQEGYDAVTAYNWPHLGMSGQGNWAPFAALIDGYHRQWEHLRQHSPVPLWPVPVSGGWDSRPWHGEANLVRFGRTPALFRQHLLAAKQFLAQTAPGPFPNNWLLIEAWNEWGEGSYIEPHQEFGFGYLDAIRDVFTSAAEPHIDLTPADVGLGPYDVPPQPVRTSWEFTQDTEGWERTMHLAELKIEEGALTARTTGRDPALFGPSTRFRASAFSSVVVRLKLARADGQPFRDTAQLFWRIGRRPEQEASSLRFEVVGDGQWHTCQLSLAGHPHWRGTITGLRLDPCTQPNVTVCLDALRLVP